MFSGFGFDTSLDLPVNSSLPPEQNDSNENDRSTFSRLRDADRALLKRFHVHYICDFMVEFKKMKYWVPVTSSEKADPHNRYHDFEIIPMPYPGSEFFRVWRDSGYAMRGLVFDWTQVSLSVC
ncbi:unnamed protein product [Echinostoma caproni]|uniref:HSF_DOMAIN domain-containing protein n=1 Tax=Echinostoma caproni TaxID=27848 RepID=A0A183B3A5_9TREM|nr:unnamed protein product [Echinostoma caproni]